MNDVHDLRRIDLNLLVVLDALLAERHVSRAAERLAMTQPAVSHALTRLRELLSDPLLVRDGARMQLTARAEALVQPLALVMAQVREIVQPAVFDPSRSRRRFRLGMSDYGTAVLLPGLMPVLRQQALQMTLEVSHHPRLEILRHVTEGRLDLGVLVAPMLPEELSGETLFREDFLCITDSANLNGKSAMSLDQYLQAPHLHVSIQGMQHSHVDDALQRMNMKRRIVAMVPHFMVAAALLPRTDLVLTVARRAVDGAMPAGLASFVPPLDIPAFDFVQVWRRGPATDPELDWLRAQLRLVADTRHA